MSMPVSVAQSMHYIECVTENSARDLAISQRNTVEV